MKDYTNVFWTDLEKINFLLNKGQDKFFHWHVAEECCRYNLGKRMRLGLDDFISEIFNDHIGE